MLISTLYFKEYPDYLLPTNINFKVIWGIAEVIILLGHENAIQNVYPNIFFLDPSLCIAPVARMQVTLLLAFNTIPHSKFTVASECNS